MIATQYCTLNTIYNAPLVVTWPTAVIIIIAGFHTTEFEGKDA